MSSAQPYERSRTRLAVLLRLFVGICGFAFMVASASSVSSPADNISLPANYGYVLIRTKTNSRINIGKRDRIIFKNYDTGESISIRPTTSYSAGVRSWLRLISATEGYYYFSRYASFDVHFLLSKPIAKTAVSVNDLFEVKSGVVNYIGDWDLTNIFRPHRTVIEDRHRLAQLKVTYDLATIEKSKAHFFEHLEKYEVFLSYKGRKAISLKDLAELLKQDSGSDDE